MPHIAKTIDQAVKSMANKEGKYLTFAMAGEDYGIGIFRVKEIIGMKTITSALRTPGYVKGWINLRGKVIPVIDLRLKFGMESIDYTERTCIIVVEMSSVERKIMMGIIVDSVSEVLNIKLGEIADTPIFGAKVDTSYILGMAKMGTGVKILLDIDRVLSDRDFQDVASAA